MQFSIVTFVYPGSGGGWVGGDKGIVSGKAGKVLSPDTGDKMGVH